MKKNKRFITIFYFLPLLFININCYSWGLYDLFHNNISGPVPLNIKGNVSTYAGIFYTSGYIEGVTGISQPTFDTPAGMVVVGSNIYVADSINNIIRRVDKTTGLVSTFAGNGIMGNADGPALTAAFNNPTGITSDGVNLYIADQGNNLIRQISISTGNVSTLAGGYTGPGMACAGLPSATCNDGIGASAAFSGPYGITINGTTLYISDQSNNVIRILDIPTATVTTLAGGATGGGTCGVTAYGFCNDGVGITAEFFLPMGIVYSGGFVYVLDNGNQVIRQIDTLVTVGSVTTIAGQAGFVGTVDGTPGSAAMFNGPSDITTDGITLYVTDSGNGTIRTIDIPTTGTGTLAGSGVFAISDGISTLADFNFPAGITFDGTDLYITDGYSVIRKLNLPTLKVTTLAGRAYNYGNQDGTGAAILLNFPQAVASDNNNIYVYESGNYIIRKIDRVTGKSSLLCGQDGVYGYADGPATTALLSGSGGMVSDGTYLYIADYNFNTVRKITIATGDVSTLAGDYLNVGSVDGTGTAAWFNGPQYMVMEGDYLYVTDYFNNTIRQVNKLTGQVTTFAGSPGIPGSFDGTSGSALFYYPTGITSDGNNLYVTDQGNYTIRKIEISSGKVTTIAGAVGITGSRDGVGTTATFGTLGNILTDGVALYFVDFGNNMVRKMIIKSGEVTTVAGSGSVGAMDGFGTAAMFDGPTDIMTDGTALFVSDVNSSVIRKIE